MVILGLITKEADSISLAQTWVFCESYLHDSNILLGPRCTDKKNCSKTVYLA